MRLQRLRTLKAKAAVFITSPIAIGLFAVSAFAIGMVVSSHIIKSSDSALTKSGTKRLNPGSARVDKPEIRPDEIFKLVNEERAKANLAPLKQNAKLEEAAMQRAKVIVDFDEYSHEAPKSGVTYQNALADVGYWSSIMGENIARDYLNPEAAVKAWMQSDSHKENVLHPDYQETGIGFYSGDIDGVHAVIVVQLFGGKKTPSYSQDYIDGWVTTLNQLREIKPGWESLKNNAAFYEANRYDVDRIVEIINIRISRSERIVSRIQANQSLTAEEHRWSYEDSALHDEQDAIATRLNN